MILQVFNQVRYLILLLLATMGYGGMAADDAPQFKFSAKNYNDQYYHQLRMTQNLDFGGFEISFNQVELTRADYRLDASVKVFRPAITLFALGEQTSQTLDGAATAKKYNRYHNSVPAVYRLTLKGYSIFEYSQGKSESLSLDKIDNRAFRKPEIMFSVTKRF